MKRKKQSSGEIKLKVVKAYHDGKSVIELSDIFNIVPKTIYNWIKYHAENHSFEKNEEELRGRPAKLTVANGKKLLSILKGPASQYGFETDLWNTSRLQIVCHKELKIKLSKMAIWRYLKKFDYSFKKVQKQYYETDISKQEDWKKKELKKIKKSVKMFKAILYFEDESNIQLSPVMGRSWGPIGEKIVHKVTGNRGSISAISAISNDGRLIFNLFDGGKRFNSDDIILFLKQMLDHHPKRHLVVVMDQAPFHKSKKVKIFEENQKRLHLFYLPTRSPELNPDEQVWAHLKNHELKSHQKTNLKDLKKLTRSKLSKLSRDTKKISGIFKRCDNSHLYF